MAPEQNGGETEVYTVQRIGPILNVECYLEAFYPTSGTLVTLVWRYVTFWNILTNSPRKMLVLWSHTSKLITTKLFCACLRASACVCVYVCCLCASLCTWCTIWSHFCLQASLYGVHIVQWMHSSTAWVAAVQLLYLAAILKLGTTCQTASLAESNICVCNMAYSHTRCPLFSTYTTWTISATNVMNSLQFTVSTHWVGPLLSAWF